MQSSRILIPVASNTVLLGLLMAVSFAKIAASFPAISSNSVAVSGPVIFKGGKSGSGSSVTPASPGGPTHHGSQTLDSNTGCSSRLPIMRI